MSMSMSMSGGTGLHVEEYYTYISNSQTRGPQAARQGTGGAARREPKTCDFQCCSCSCLLLRLVLLVRLRHRELDAAAAAVGHRPRAEAPLAAGGHGEGLIGPPRTREAKVRARTVRYVDLHRSHLRPALCAARVPRPYSYIARRGGRSQRRAEPAARARALLQSSTLSD